MTNEYANAAGDHITISRVPDERDAKIAELRKLCRDVLNHGIDHIWGCGRRMLLSLPCSCGADCLAARLRAAAEGK